MIARMRGFIQSLFPSRFDREEETMHRHEISVESQNSISRFQQSLDDLNEAVAMLFDSDDDREYRNDHSRSK